MDDVHEVFIYPGSYLVTSNIIFYPHFHTLTAINMVILL